MLDTTARDRTVRNLDGKLSDMTVRHGNETVRDRTVREDSDKQNTKQRIVGGRTVRKMCYRR